MGVVQIAAASVGFLIISVTVWQLIRNGLARSNGKVPEPDDSWMLPPW
jgi:hypothetical protein